MRQLVSLRTAPRLRKMVLDKHHREQHQQLPEPLGYEPVVLLHMGKQLLFAADKKAAYLSGKRHADLRYLLEFKHSRNKNKRNESSQVRSARNTSAYRSANQKQCPKIIKMFQQITQFRKFERGSYIHNTSGGTKVICSGIQSSPLTQIQLSWRRIVQPCLRVIAPKGD